MFEMPQSGSVIMVGPGTGVVPFIGFLETWKLSPYKEKTYLYFGCRREESDFIFRDFLKQQEADG